MKKIFVLLILLTIILLNSYSKQTEFSLSNYFDIGTITSFKNGESIYFTNFEVNDALKKLNAEIKFTEYIKNKDLTILYCKSPIIPKSVDVKNFNINLQIAITDDYTVIGWPMILGSF